MKETNMLTIRPESPADYATLHDIHIRAFDNRMGEATLVSLLRTRSSYDSELSLVAEKEGRVVGHAMFNPMQVYINGKPVKATNLAPLAIHPDFQKQGIGGELMRAGHRIAREKGYSFDFLLGHTEYYPRFGYHTATYGVSSVTVTVESLPGIDLETTSPLYDDVPALANLHQENEKNVNLSIVPEQNLSEWLSPNLAIPCTVYRHQGEIVGYSRGTNEDVRQFLARDDEMARAIAKKLAGDVATITLPLHPDSSSANAFDETALVTAWEAAMICPLQDDSPVHDYLKSIENGASVGRVIWSSCFDIA